MVLGDGHALEDVILGMIQRRCARIDRWRNPVRAITHPHQDLLFVPSQPRPLLLAQFHRRNLSELVSPRFANQHGDLVVAWFPSMLLYKSGDCLIALTAALAEPCE